MSGLELVQLRPPLGGLDTESPPDLMPRDRAPELENFLVHRPNKLVMRGGIRNGDDIYTDWDGGVAGAWVFDDRLLMGKRAVSATAVVDPWLAPITPVPAAELVDADTGSLRHLDLESGTITVVGGATEDHIPGPRFTRLGSYVYGITLDSSLGSALHGPSGGFQKATRMLRWDGTTALPTIGTANVSPEFAQDVRAYLDRLFVLGGRVNGGTAYRNRLFWSDPGQPTLGAATEWQDDVSGLVNQLTVGSDEQNDFGVALAVIRNGLVIFKRHSIYLLSGRTPDTFALRQVSGSFGCLDARSVVEYEDAVYFMSERGYMHFDGVEFRNASENVGAEVGAAVILTASPGGFARASLMPEGHILLVVGQEYYGIAGSEGSQIYFSGLYYPPRRAWTRFSTDDAVLVGGALAGFPNAEGRGYVVHAARTTNHYVGLDAKNYVLLDDLATGDVNQFDAVPGVATKHRIPARVHYPYVPLGTPATKGQLHRIMLGYRMNVTNGSTAFSTSVYSADGTQLLSSSAAPDHDDIRRVEVRDVFTEAHEAQLRVEWLDPVGDVNESPSTAEIHLAAIEFQRTHQRRSG